MKETLRHVSHTLQYRGGWTVGVCQDVFCVSVVGRARALFPIGPAAGPSLLLQGLATGFRTSKETGIHFHEGLPQTADLDTWYLPEGVDLGRFDGGRGQRQTGVGSVYQTLASSSHHCLVSVSRSVSPGQVCQNHFVQCPLRGGLQESARTTGHSQSDDASVSHLLARRPARVRSGDTTIVWVLDVGFASGLGRLLPSVCRPLKRPKGGHGPSLIALRIDTPEPLWDDGRTVQWVLEGSPSIGLGS